LDEWLGAYGHRGMRHMSFILYQENNEYLGYFNIGWARNGEHFYDRILVSVQGTRDTIRVYYLKNFPGDNIMNEEYQQFTDYQKGELLFSLQNKNGGILTEWGRITPDEEAEYLERGFVREDELPGLILRNDEDRAYYLKACGIKDKALPFYQYSDDSGKQVEVFFDTAKRVGVGIYNYDSYTEGFGIGEYRHDVWNHDKFSLMTEEYDASSYGEPAEHKTCNERGQLTHFYTEVTHDLSTDEPFLDKALEVEFIYREDGTLEQKHCWHNPVLFGSFKTWEHYYYDSAERLQFASSYITHGSIKDYYIYEGDGEYPSYRLSLDFGWRVRLDDFVKFASE
jgi:hypothetical protein